MTTETQTQLDNDPNRCPLCGQDNRCGNINGGNQPCWCFNGAGRLPEQVKQWLNEQNLTAACVCADCIRKAWKKTDQP